MTAEYQPVTQTGGAGSARRAGCLGGSITVRACGVLSALGKAANMDAQTTIELIALLVALISLVIQAIEFGTNHHRKE